MTAPAQLLTRTLTCLALALVPLPTLAAPSESDVDEPNADEARAAFDEGKQAFRLGKFGSATASFERAYELSNLPDILYNIGLAHLRWYDIDPDVTHLRTAKAILENYILEIEKDPEVGDIEEAEQLIAEADAKISEADDTELEPVPASTDTSADPGRGLRVGGGVAMGLGGALVIGGVAGGVAFGGRGVMAQDDLTAVYADRDAMGCTPPTTSDACTEIFDRIDTLRAEGQRANALAYGLGVGLGAVGLVAVAVGAVLFVTGKRARENGGAEVSVAPTWFGDDGRGLVITGRF